MSPRKSYEFKDKRSTVQKVDVLVAGGFSRHKACRFCGIPPLYYRRWVKLLKKVDTLIASESYVSHKMNSTARKLHFGCRSILTEITTQLKHFIFVIHVAVVYFYEAFEILPPQQNFVDDSYVKI
jgi:hypothetical protein